MDFSFRRPQLEFARVLENTTATAQLVSDHFLSRGFRNFLFYSDADNWVYNERGTVFEKAVESAGRDVKWLRWQTSFRLPHRPQGLEAKTRMAGQ